MMRETSWERTSVKAYIGRIFGGYLAKCGSGETKQFRVMKEFLRVSEKEYLAHFTQKRLVVPQYDRSKHDAVVQFEFLLPLSKEEQLKRALDELFYVDTLQTKYSGAEHFQESLHPCLSCPFSERLFSTFCPSQGPSGKAT
jgi:hypothetical protein